MIAGRSSSGLNFAYGQPLDKQASVRLSKDEKIAKAKPLFK